jgi:glycosyltransferase involved in cell wall biosynthesis
MNEKVSILMNCFNGEDYLKNSLDSIFSQDYKNFEIIFVDNHSRDKSLEIASSYNDERLIIKSTPKHCNLGQARNFASQFFSGKYLAFLDVDDVWVPHKLSTQISIMEELDLVLTYGGARTINDSGEVISDFTPFHDAEVSFGRLLYRYNINQQTVVINIHKVPVKFLESKKYAPDNPLFMNIIGKHESECKIINQHLVDYRIHSANISKSLLKIRYREGLSTLRDLNLNFPDHAKTYRVQFFIAIFKKIIQSFIADLIIFLKIK